MKRLIGIGLLLAWLGLGAQTSYRLGLLPQVNQNLPLGERLRLNLQLEARPWVARGDFGSPEQQAGYRLTDLSVLLSRPAGPLRKWSGGYLLRHTPRGWHHRLMQQYAWVQPRARLRLGHRLAADQTFGVGLVPEYRLRYRLSAEIPLAGAQVDPGEGYFKLSNEYLNGWQGRQYDLELRLVPTVGFLFTDGNKLEAGFDYRLDGFLASAIRHTFFFRLSWYRKW